MNQYVKRVFDAFERGRRFVTRDMWQLGRPGERLPRGFVIKHARVAVLVVTGFVKDDLLMRASALTLASLLSLVPILAVMFWVINAFSLENDVYGYLYSITEKAFSVVTQTPSPGSDAAAGGVTSEPGPFAGETPRRAADFPLRDVLVGLFFRKIPPQAGGDAYLDPVDFLVNYAADQAKHSGTIGVSGLALVLVAIFGLMSNIEFAFNRIWGLSNRRSWYRMISDYTMVTLLLPVVCTALLGVTAVLSSQSMHAQLGRFAALMTIPQIAVMAIALACLYAFIPAVKVRLVNALTGGLGAAILLHLVTNAYLHSQGLLARYSILYSSFAQAPLLLLWIFAAWVVVLLGAELAFAYQNEQTFAIERFARQASHAYRETVALRAMIEIGQRFAEGKMGVEPAEAAQAWNVPLRLLNETLDQLEAANLLRRCATDPVTYLPARPVENIRVLDIKRAIREAGEDPSPLREDPQLRALVDGLPVSRDAETLAAVLEALREET